LDSYTEKLTVAALGLAGAVLAVPLIRLVNRLLDWRSQLLVEVMVNESPKSRALYDEIWEMRRKGMTLDERISEPLTMFNRFDSYLNADTYIRVKLTNNMSKKLVNPTLVLSSVSSPIVQIEDGEISEIVKCPFLLPDLQPRRDLTIHILCTGFWARSAKDIRKALALSAEEEIRTRYRFPLPAVWKTRAERLGRVVFAMVWLLLVFLVSLVR